MNKISNDTEQYSRSNNIRIHGIVSGNARETAEETTDIVIKNSKTKKWVSTYEREDIDVAHRLKKFVRGSQEAIVREQSRLVKDKILRNKKSLKGTGIFINEDLTKLNQEVFMDCQT